ncbi:MAG: amidohydrolase family protein [Vicinamibacterales bacterium]
MPGPRKRSRVSRRSRPIRTGRRSRRSSENQRGRLEPGQLADFAVLTQDIFTVPPDRLPATESVLTVIGGLIVYGSLPPAR